MATQTENLKLIKPDKTDFYNVDDFNHNIDIMDKEITELKPDIIVNGTKGNKVWKHKTLVLTDFKMSYSESAARYHGSVNVSELLPDEEILDILVKSIIAERVSFKTNIYYDYEIFVSYVAYIDVAETPFWEISIRSNKSYSEKEMVIPRLIIDIIYK